MARDAVHPPEYVPQGVLAAGAVHATYPDRRVHRHGEHLLLLIGLVMPG